MATHTYLDFELEIERHGDDYTVTASWEGGRAKRTFSLPFSDDELERLEEEINSERDAERWGRKLFDAVFVGDVRICLENCQSRARFQGAGLRLKFHLGDAPQLAALPWEYLVDPTTHGFFALFAESPIVRYVDMLRSNPVLPIRPPLRILAMISSPIDQPEALNVGREKDNLREALGSLVDAGKVVLDVEEDANLRTLQNRLLQAKNEGAGYHIFHFVGHGQFDEAEGEGLLLLEDEEERSRSVSGRRLGTYLFGHHTLRLAVLNACEGARASATRPFGSVAKTLVQRGIPAVVAMRVQISDRAAIDFARQFYAAIAEGWPVDAALAEGRKAIYTESEVEWATPILFMGVDDGRVFDLSGAIGGPAEKPGPPAGAPTSLPEQPAPLAPASPPADGLREELLQWVIQRSGGQMDASTQVLVRFLRGEPLSEVDSSSLINSLVILDQELANKVFGGEQVTDADILGALAKAKQRDGMPQPTFIEAAKRIARSLEQEPALPQVGGMWQNIAIGGGISIAQNGQMLSVTEYNAFGVPTGRGSGQIMGRQLYITIQNYVLGVMVSAQLELSPDGTTLSGMISIPGIPPTPATFVLQG